MAWFLAADVDLCCVIKPLEGLGWVLLGWLCKHEITLYDGAASTLPSCMLACQILRAAARAHHHPGCCAGMGSDYVIEPPSTLAALESDDDRADDDDEAPLNREVSSEHVASSLRHKPCEEQAGRLACSLSSLQTHPAERRGLAACPHSPLLVCGLVPALYLQEYGPLHAPASALTCASAALKTGDRQQSAVQKQLAQP